VHSNYQWQYYTGNVNDLSFVEYLQLGQKTIFIMGSALLILGKNQPHNKTVRYVIKERILNKFVVG